MSAADFTRLLVIAAIILLVIYDLIVISMYGKDASISCVFFEYAKANPIVAFAAGLVMGHIFWKN